MKSRGKIGILLFFIFGYAFSELSCMSVAEVQKPRRLAIFFDYFNDERPVGSYVVANDLAINFYQEACSCIVSKSVFLNFLTREKEVKNPLLLKNKLKNWDIYYVKDTPLFVVLKKDARAKELRAGINRA